MRSLGQEHQVPVRDEVGDTVHDADGVDAVFRRVLGGGHPVIPRVQQVAVRPSSSTQYSMVSGVSQWMPDWEYRVPLKSVLAVSGVKSCSFNGSLPRDSSRALAP